MPFVFDKIINTTGSSDLCFRPLTPKLEDDMSIIWKKVSDVF